MTMKARHLVLLLAGTIALGACSHSRTVERDGKSGSAGSGRAQSPSRAAPTPIPANGSYTVRAGETLYGISFRFGLKFQDVAAWNGIRDPYVIKVGQRLRLRPAGQNQPRTSPAPKVPGSAMAGATGTTTPQANAYAGTATALPSPAWRWPTQGQIIGRYVAGDQTQQGINIAGTSGQGILAAADGVVVYSGAGLVGYGELIIIKHSDEWLSAYAHNRRRLVGEGTRVKTGEAIAEMGRTGASRDMLHFEIRRNGKPVDPLVYLPRQ
jgi:lipoprotein NlpD